MSTPPVLDARQAQEVYDAVGDWMEKGWLEKADSRSTYGTILRSKAGQHAMVIDADTIFCFKHEMVEYKPNVGTWSVLLPGTTK